MGQHLSNLHRRLSSRVSPLQTERQRVTELESQLIAKQDRELELENHLSRTQERVDELERQLREAENLRSREFSSSQARVNELETQLREEQSQLSRSQERVNFFERQSREAPNVRDWVTNRNDIQITYVELGRGVWGIVYRGKFHGCDVAVKQMNENIMSPNTRRVFEREVGMASKCRHPCLLQFIGATTDERPLLVTELLDCSLRERLYLNPRGGQLLSADEVPVISLDVARALNYLHQKPKPIVHNDVSSGNVLLWRYGGQWRAKLSDYGTANFVRESNINYAGAVIYSAPESKNENPDHPISCKVSLCWIG